MTEFLHLLDTILFILLACSVGYLFIFSLFSLRRGRPDYSQAKKESRFIVLFPAYREDAVIVSSVERFLEQDYPREMYDVAVISDRMQEETNVWLQTLPIKLFRVDFEESSKAKALRFAVEQLGKEPYDMVVILDADNQVEPDFLRRMNDAFYSGSTAIQAHRVAKNPNTDTALLDALSEEINNSIFRKGHVEAGLSSALIGSGMAFDYRWFREHVDRLVTAGEDKELEVMLLKEGIYIDYLERVKVYDEKTGEERAFSRQRRRWLATQFDSLGRSLRDLPGALFSGNWDYADKLIQWMMPSRLILLGTVGLLGLAVLCFDPVASLKWWGMLFVLLLALAFATPDYLVDDRLRKTLRKVPLLFVLMVVNLFCLRGAGRKFIHTRHAD